MPGLTLFRDYRREWLSADLLAGVSVCVVMIPSVIAYAGLMGLSPLPHLSPFCLLLTARHDKIRHAPERNHPLILPKSRN